MSPKRLHRTTHTQPPPLLVLSHPPRSLALPPPILFHLLLSSPSPLVRFFPCCSFFFPFPLFPPCVCFFPHPSFIVFLRHPSLPQTSQKASVNQPTSLPFLCFLPPPFPTPSPCCLPSPFFLPLTSSFVSPQSVFWLSLPVLSFSPLLLSFFHSPLATPPSTALLPLPFSFPLPTPLTRPFMKPCFVSVFPLMDLLFCPSPPPLSPSP